MEKLIDESGVIWNMQSIMSLTHIKRDDQVKIRVRSGIQKRALELELKRKKLTGRPRKR
jgi:hypothetical protein